MDISQYTKILFSYIVLVLLQVMVFNNINIGSLGITPMFYVLFVLMVPYEVPGWIQLFFGFVMGYTIDIFCDTPGLNAASTVAMVFCREKLLRFISPRDGYENGTRPYLMVMGLNWFLSYSIPLVFVHHICYFLLDAFGFDHFLQTLGKIIFTSVCTEIFVIFSQYIAYRRK